jgi:hypothetical protein
MDFPLPSPHNQPISARKRMELMTSPQQTESQLTQRTQYEEEVTVDLDLTDEETPNPAHPAPAHPPPAQPKPESKEAHITRLSFSTKSSTNTLLTYILFKTRSL